MLDKRSLRLYAVTDRRWTGEQSLMQQIRAALEGGVTMVQLREKGLDPQAFLHEAIKVKSLCAQFGVPLIINDNLDVALTADADGVHIGQDDMDPRQARDLLGTSRILGVTVKSVEAARAAQAAGADYLGCGAVFSTSTKTDASRINHSMFARICDSVRIPVVAIGGITRENLSSLRGLGMEGFALVSAIFGAENITDECRVLRRLTEESVLGK